MIWLYIIALVLFPPAVFLVLLLDLIIAYENKRQDREYDEILEKTRKRLENGRDS